MLWKNRNLRISRRRKVGFRDFSQNLRRLSGQTSPTLAKQTVVVVIITIILAAVISVMDSGILECINFLMK